MVGLVLPWSYFHKKWQRPSKLLTKLLICKSAEEYIFGFQIDTLSWKKNNVWKNIFSFDYLLLYFRFFPMTWRETYPIPDYDINNHAGFKFHHLLSLDSLFIWTQASFRRKGRKRKFLTWNINKDIYLQSMYKTRYLFDA